MSGLTAAYSLAQSGIQAEVYEGRDRLGGRTHTVYCDDSKRTYYEEGGTFLDDDHDKTIELAKELGVELIKRGFGSKKITVVHQDNIQDPADTLKALASLKGKLGFLWSQLENDYDKHMLFHSDARE